jgi:nucleoside-diphosphate-sugar epimerase
MKVFVTGATGWIGSATVRELLGAKHEVVGLARSEAAASALRSAGAQPLRGSLDDPASLRRGAETADGVIHTAFVHDRSPLAENGGAVIHDFSNFVANSETDRRAIEALGGVLAGTRKPLVVAAGLPFVKTGGRAMSEDDVPDYAVSPVPRVSEKTAAALAGAGTHVSVVRLPPSVHGEGDRGFVPDLIEIARAKGSSAYVGDGTNRWPAVHRLDAARAFRLALEAGGRGTIYHAVGDPGVPFREIAARIGRGIGVPVIRVEPAQAAEQFVWLGGFVVADNLVSSAKTQERLGWRPLQPGLLEDLEQGHYFRR